MIANTIKKARRYTIRRRGAESIGNLKIDRELRPGKIISASCECIHSIRSGVSTAVGPSLRISHHAEGFKRSFIRPKSIDDKKSAAGTNNGFLDLCFLNDFGFRGNDLLDFYIRFTGDLVRRCFEIVKRDQKGEYTNRNRSTATDNSSDRPPRFSWRLATTPCPGPQRWTKQRLKLLLLKILVETYPKFI